MLSARLAHLHRQSLALNVAVILAGIGGAATCAAVLALFVGALRDMTVAAVLFGLFGLAVVCALGAIAAYTVEMVIAGSGIRTEVAQSRREAAEDEAVEAEAHPAGNETAGERAARDHRPATAGVHGPIERCRRKQTCRSRLKKTSNWAN
jgi:hypothetical protein